MTKKTTATATSVSKMLNARTKNGGGNDNEKNVTAAEADKATTKHPELGSDEAGTTQPVLSGKLSGEGASSDSVAVEDPDGLTSKDTGLANSSAISGSGGSSDADAAPTKGQRDAEGTGATSPDAKAVLGGADDDTEIEDKPDYMGTICYHLIPSNPDYPESFSMFPPTPALVEMIEVKKTLVCKEYTTPHQIKHNMKSKVLEGLAVERFMLEVASRRELAQRGFAKGRGGKC